MLSKKHFTFSALSVFFALVACLLSGCGPAAALNATTSKNNYDRAKGIAYGPSARQRLDVYAPKAAPVASPPAMGTSRPPPERAVIVFIYGGSWQNGDKDTYMFAGAALAAHGYVVVIPDYRVYPETAFPGFVEDAAAAAKWAHDHAAEFGGDPKRIFLMGHSAGAEIAGLLAFDGHYLERENLSPRDFKGFVGLSGPYDFLPLTDPKLMEVFPETSRQASQPINFVRPGAIPVFLGVGDKDKTVDPGNTERLAAKLRAAGDFVELRHYPGLGHAPVVGALAAPFHRIEPVFDDVTQFIDSH